MKEIKLTKGFVALVDDEDFNFLNQWKWGASRNASGLFYAKRNSYNKLTKKTTRISMHRLILNAEINQIVDHINGNSLDNRRENIRFVSHTQNAVNRKVPANSSSGFKGVRKLSYKRKDGSDIWVAYGQMGKVRWRKNFRTFNEAVSFQKIKHEEVFGNYNRIKD